MDLMPKYLLIIFIAMFALTASLVICYLVYAFRLIYKLKKHDNDLWKSLSEPSILGSLNPFHNVFKEIKSAFKFCKWLFNGAKGTTNPKTTALAAKTSILFKVTLPLILIFFVINFIFIYITLNANS